jgi:O-antigen/teichoic acid export membrane protein
VDERSFRNPKLGRLLLIAYKAIADFAGKGSLFLVTVLAARRLSADAFGIFSLGSTLGWMVAVATDFGIQLHVAREIARRPESAAAVARTWLRVRWVTAAASILVIVAGTSATPLFRPFAAPIVLLAIVYACSGLIEFLYYVYRGFSRTDIESTLTLWQRAGTLVCGAIALVWWPDVTVLAIAMLVPNVVTFAAGARIAARLAEPHLPLPFPTAARRRPDVGLEFRRDVWPIGAGIVLSAIYFRVDVLLIQLWIGTPAVGLYNAVFRLVEALRLLPAAVMAVMLPSLCRAADLRPLVRAAAPLTAAAVGIAVVLWIAADALIPALYQPRYAAAVPAFRILLLSFPLMSLNMALTHQLVGWHGQRAYAVLCAMALVVNLALNARLLPAWSIDGAAWATLGTEMFLTAGCVVALWMAQTGAVPESVTAA